MLALDKFIKDEFYQKNFLKIANVNKLNKKHTHDNNWYINWYTNKVDIE